jgi:NMD protein affecting ribosome stability and mRNA decay
MGHRTDFETCPHCQFVAHPNDWEEAASILVLNPYYPKAGHVSVITECSNCHEKSWVHKQIDVVTIPGLWPDKWREAVLELKNQIQLKVVRQWAVGLCGRCTKLETAKAEYAARRSCVRGIGSVEVECDQFVQLGGSVT